MPRRHPRAQADREVIEIDDSSSIHEVIQISDDDPHDVTQAGNSSSASGARESAHRLQTFSSRSRHRTPSLEIVSWRAPTAYPAEDFGQVPVPTAPTAHEVNDELPPLLPLQAGSLTAGTGLSPATIDTIPVRKPEGKEMAGARQVLYLIS